MVLTLKKHQESTNEAPQKHQYGTTKELHKHHKSTSTAPLKPEKLLYAATQTQTKTCNPGKIQVKLKNLPATIPSARQDK
jgi:hypothetical protein